MAGWRFYIDRGGTFTDVVARAPDGSLHVAKLLSDDTRHGMDASLAAMRRIAGDAAIDSVRMGTTVATNALLERKVEPTCLAITEGFGDVLLIGTQARPQLFSLEIRKPEPLFSRVVEIEERVLADGTVRRDPEPNEIWRHLRTARLQGATSLAVVLVHGFAWPHHERLVEQLGREAGFEHVSVSYDVAPEPGLVARGDTTCVDACLTPILRRHVGSLRTQLTESTSLLFMTSAGGLVRAEAFRGKDSLLSGPAGGAIAMAAVAKEAGLDAALGFDMGGTSTDACRWAAKDGVDRVNEREIAGVRVRAPMLDIVTVAAGGGSILARTARRLSVGPESAGADPGPACYGRGGPATITDANLVLGRIHPDFFPRCFGTGDDPLDVTAAHAALATAGRGNGLGIEEAAAGFVRIANENMAAAIREVSLARGRDPAMHALIPFGGAGGQHACAIAELLGIRSIVLHPLAGVLSACGLALADIRREHLEPVLAPLDDETLREVELRLERAVVHFVTVIETEEGVEPDRVSVSASLDLRHRGADLVLNVPVGDLALDAETLRVEFEARHRALCGFARPELEVEIAALRVEVVGVAAENVDRTLPRATGPAVAHAMTTAWFDLVDEAGTRRTTPRVTAVFQRAALLAGQSIDGPALIAEEGATSVIDPGWRATVDERGLLRVEHVALPRRELVPTALDPVRLEIFANRFMSIAEQMGRLLVRVSHSPNMKERLDFSCGIFTSDGRLVANAPHVPVHLGAMGETVRALLEERGEASFRAGQVILSNDPFRGGSHLPDITVVTPVFSAEGELVLFTACRGHHADIGGPIPGSMPPDSRKLSEEGVLLHDVVLVEDGAFRESELRALLGAGEHPVRDISERIADLEAQAAANALGARLLGELMAEAGQDVVLAYMRHVMDDAAAATRELIARLPRGVHRFEDLLDEGSRIAVAVSIDEESATFDFTGTSAQHEGNLNAPRAITTAAVLYVLRCLVGRSIPLNAGTLEPVRIIVPEGSLLSPLPPAAVAGGNVETSMRIADVLLAALGAQAASQGTMNNLTFGNELFGYYETIGGGAGAGPTFRGASAVHSHLTNTRITDVEILERRHPVIVLDFKIRVGSGGAGKHPGGNGIERAIEFLQPMRAAVLSERRATRPFGLAGGKPGKRGRNVYVRADGEVFVLKGRVQLDVEPGDVLLVATPGGGGWGEP